MFTLKWTKRRTPLITPEEEQTTDKFSEAPDFITGQNCTPYKEAIIGYIGGYIVTAMVKDISCEVCAEVLLYKKDQMTTALRASFESLIFIKDIGGLITSPADVFEVLTVAEKLFRRFISDVNRNEQKISSSKQSFNKVRLMVLPPWHGLSSFKQLNGHDREHEFWTEDLHSSQVIKTIVNKYLTMRFYRYGQQYTRNVIQKGKLGLRQQSNK